MKNFTGSPQDICWLVGARRRLDIFPSIGVGALYGRRRAGGVGRGAALDVHAFILSSAKMSRYQASRWFELTSRRLKVVWWVEESRTLFALVSSDLTVTLIQQK